METKHKVNKIFTRERSIIIVCYRLYIYMYLLLENTYILNTYTQ